MEDKDMGPDLMGRATVYKLGLALVLLTAAVGAQTTPNIGLNIPAHGTPNYDTLLNPNFTLIDNLLSGVLPIPGLKISTLANGCLNITATVVGSQACAPGSVTHTVGALGLNALLAGNGAGDIKQADALGVVYTVGTITTDINPLNVNWITNNAGTTFSGLKFSVTNTAQNAASKNFQWCGGVSAAQCVSFDPNANISTPGSLTAGSGDTVAGATDFGGGTQRGLPTNAFGISTQGSSSMTGWRANYPAAAASGLINWTNTAGQVNGAFITPAAAGDVLCAAGGTWARFAGNTSGTKVLTEDASGVCSWALGGGSAFPVTVSGGVSGGIPCFTSTTNEAVSVLLTANVLTKGGGAGVCPTNSSITDNGTTVATAEPIVVGTANCTTFGTAGGDCGAEGTAQTNVASTAARWYDSTSHEMMMATNGASTATPGMMVRRQPSPINATAQTAAIGTATLCASAAGACNTAGQYHVHWNMWGSGTACSNVTAGSATFLLTWTDENAVAHSAVALQMMGQTGAATVAMASAFPFQTALANESASGDFTFSTNGSVIQYATGYTACTTGTGTYNLRAAVTRVQ